MIKNKLWTNLNEKLNQWLLVILPIVWSDVKLKNNNKGVKTKFLNILKYGYASGIIFACIASFLIFFIPSGQDASIAAKVFLTLAQVPVFFIFVIDYLAHILTYPLRETNIPRWKSYLRFSYSFTSIVIFLCILASVNVVTIFAGKNAINSHVLNVFNTFSLVRIIRLLLVLRLFSPFKIIFDVFSSQKKVLIYVFIMILVLITIFALVIWNAEISEINKNKAEFIQAHQDSYNLFLAQSGNEIEAYNALVESLPAEAPSIGGTVTNFWDSLYFTTITLTTIGYGDFSPHSPTAKFVVIVVSILGIAIIAIPSGVIAGSFLQQIQTHLSKSKQDKESKQSRDEKASQNLKETHD